MSNINNEIGKKNIMILRQFEDELKKDYLSTKTIKSHIGNLDFFCTYLSYYEQSKSLGEVDTGDVSDFLGDFFPRKALWASPAHVKSNISTFRKFFKFCLTLNYIQLDEYNDLLELIKEDKNLWIEAAL